MEFSKVRRLLPKRPSRAVIEFKDGQKHGDMFNGIPTVNSWVWHFWKKDIMMKFHRLGTPTANQSFSVFADGLQQGDEVQYYPSG